MHLKLDEGLLDIWIPCQASLVAQIVKYLLQCRRPGFGRIPGLGRSPRGSHGNPLQYSGLENPHGQRKLADCSPWGRQRIRHDWSDLASTHPLCSAEGHTSEEFSMTKKDLKHQEDGGSGEKAKVQGLRALFFSSTTEAAPRSFSRAHWSMLKSPWCLARFERNQSG